MNTNKKIAKLHAQLRSKENRKRHREFESLMYYESLDLGYEEWHDHIPSSGMTSYGITREKFEEALANGIRYHSGGARRCREWEGLFERGRISWDPGQEFIDEKLKEAEKHDKVAKFYGDLLEASLGTPYDDRVNVGVAEYVENIFQEDFREKNKYTFSSG